MHRLNEEAATLDYARPGTVRRRIPRSVFVVVAILLCSAVAALIEYRPAVMPQTGLLRGDRRAIPALLVWLFAIVYIVQRTREDAGWPCAGLVLVAIAGAASLTLFAFQCVLWREQLKYGDRSDEWTVLPFAVAVAAFAVAAVGRGRTKHCTGPGPRRSL
jgi:hypothetical protein